MGDACRLDDNVVVEDGVRLGARVIVKAGARIGTPGFGFVPSETGHLRMRHPGGCVVGDDVEIGANTTVDSGTVGPTSIGRGTKIDNLVQIAHNVEIGEDCVILAQAGIAGSTVIENGVAIAGQAGLAGHLTIGTGARVAAQSGVIGDVAPGETVSGYPARKHRDVLRQSVALRRITERLDELEALASHQ
jgi:UDP-3-O-[3-hydroxymyristoyl] glucosamine N-acyltransferase